MRATLGSFVGSPKISRALKQEGFELIVVFVKTDENELIQRGHTGDIYHHGNVRIGEIILIVLVKHNWESISGFSVQF